MTGDVLVDPPVAGVAGLRINRPSKRNALSLAVKAALADELDAWRRDVDVRAVVVSGEGQDFAAGSDLNDLVAWTPMDHLRLETDRMWSSLEAFPKPVIAAVVGRAWGGGCELAMACDVVLADHTASFAQPEVRLGIPPGAGGIQRLFRLVGRARGMRMVLTGDAISAQEAFRVGLVSECVERDIVGHARALATRIAAMPPLAVLAIKQLAHSVDNAPLEAGLRLERQAFVQLCGSDDMREGMNAFLDKRSPIFTGK